MRTEQVSVAITLSLYSGGVRFPVRLPTSYPNWVFSWGSSAYPGDYRRNTLKYATIASF
jgi:hypothetical protein